MVAEGGWKRQLIFGERLDKYGKVAELVIELDK